MIEIIKHGQTKFRGKCHFCGCEFTYELSDVQDNGYVICPDCGDRISWKHSIASHTQPETVTFTPCAVEDNNNTFFQPVNNGGVKPV